MILIDGARRCNLFVQEIVRVNGEGVVLSQVVTEPLAPSFSGIQERLTCSV